MEIGFLIRTMPYTYENMDTAYHLARHALEAAHKVRIFLYEDSVIAASARIRSGSERNQGERIRELIGLGAEVSVCATCCRFRGLPREDLVEGTRVAGMTSLARMVEECDRVVTLGS